MKYNSGDIDDLFRRASEQYPLRTDGADWDRLAGDLDAGPMPPSSDKEERRRRWGLLWWFLLIPLAGIGYLTWEMGMHHAQPKSIAVAPATRSGAGGSQSAAGGQQSAGGGGEAHGLAGSNAAGAANPAGGAAAQSAPGPANPAGVSAPSFATGRRVGEAQTGWHKRTDRNLGTPNGGMQDAANTPPASSNTPPAVAVDHDPALAPLDLRRMPVGEDFTGSLDLPGPAVPTGKQSPPAKKSANRQSHGYIGLTGAPDFSTVKFQPMKGVGTTFGLVLGYAFNDHWAVETGLDLDRKRYYTDGEYFNTSKVRMPTYTKLLNVDGTCYMWEIPVNIRYNFNTGSRIRWFATAGLSTYLMSKENYTYQYEYWSGGSAEDSSWKIDRPSQYWFTIINVSGGFEERLGKAVNLRFEPYLRIPMSGIGTGKLAIMSAGLNIGLTYRLW